MRDRASLQHLCDPETFRTLGHSLVDKLADRLKESLSGEGIARPSQSPEAAVAEWKEILEHSISRQPCDITSVFDKWIDRSIKSHHPQVMGHQVGVSAPVAALAELTGALLDTGNGVFEVGNPATAIERVVIKDLTARLGMSDLAGGYLTSGGTLGNLTALLAARQASSGYNVWQEGNQDARPLGVLVSDEAHYCIDRAARVMGWGAKGVVRVPVDQQSRIMRRPALQDALDRATAEGIQVIAVVANACTTATGSFDPLDEISEFAIENRLWFHVDAAHGGAVVFSKKHRHLIEGIQHADSIVIDFHKLMLTPALTTAVIFKNEATSFGAFAQQAEYLWRTETVEEPCDHPQLPWHDAARRTMECTRPMAALRIFALLTTGGERSIAENVDTLFATASEFAEIITVTEGFELLTKPTANILCFRLSPEGISNSARDVLNSGCRKRLIEEENFYIVETKVNGETWLRSAIMNPFTESTHFLGLLRALKRISKEVSS